MATPIVLTAQQSEAVSWLLERLCDTDPTPLVALRGLAGTGKTTVIPTLRSLLEAEGIPCLVGSPTHRAAMVLKRKGIPDAATIHHHALTTYFDPDYTHACVWLGEVVAHRLQTEASYTPDVNGVPWLVATVLQGQQTKPETVKRRARQYGAQKALDSIGISGKQHFDGHGPKQGQEGCLIIDEASMVGREMLDLCCEAFPLVCLVGDPGQLPPVKAGSCLAEVEGFDLTEVHRQALDSPIIRLAYQAREGREFWHALPLVDGAIEAWRGVEAQVFLEAPLIVWRNATRLECTALIRQGLGYPGETLQVGEPLVCRATHSRDRAEGFYNNALFRVVEVSPSNPRLVTVQEDCGEGTHEVFVHMEELHGDYVDPESVPFRFAYCLTCHTAQGGEWPVVYISEPDLFAHAGFAKRQADNDMACWSYTAITRAKQTLGFLKAHDFSRSLQVSIPGGMPGAPMPRKHPEPPYPQPANTVLTLGGDDTPPSPAPLAMTTNGSVPPSTPEPPEDQHPWIPGVDEPDDIPDPVVPPPLPAVRPALTASTPDASITAAIATTPVPPIPENMLPLAHGFVTYLQGIMHRWMIEESAAIHHTTEACLASIRDWARGVFQSNEHAQYQLSDALLKMLQDGVKVVSPPYQAVIHATSADGFQLSLTITKTSSGELVEELGRIEGWLVKQGYSGITAQAA